MARVSRPRQALRRTRHVVFVGGQQAEALNGEQLPEQRAAGTIRRNWLSTVASTPAPAPFSWADNPRTITRAIHYKASSLFRAAGTSRAINAETRAIRVRNVRQSAITRQAGNRQGRPTVRNRLTSFGSRVPPLNPPSPNAES